MRRYPQSHAFKRLQETQSVNLQSAFTLKCINSLKYRLTTQRFPPARIYCLELMYHKRQESTQIKQAGPKSWQLDL